MELKDNIALSYGKAALVGGAGAMLAGGGIGFAYGQVGALPGALWALPGGIAAGVLGEVYERSGLSNANASLAGTLTVAVPGIATAFIAGRMGAHPAIAGAAALIAVGAVGGGLLGTLIR